MSRRKRSDGLGFDVLTFTLRAIVWGGILLFVLGLAVVGCEALGRGLDAAGRGGGDARASRVTVAAVRETTSELRAEMYSQALNAAGYEVKRSYGHGGWRSMRDAFVAGDGAFVVPVQAKGDEPDAAEFPGATVLRPTREPVGGLHLAPVVGTAFVDEHPDAAEALDETTERLDPEEFEEMARAVDSGESLVVAEVYEWRAANGLPPAPGVRPPEEEERRA